MNPIDYDGSGLSVTSSVLSHEQLSSYTVRHLVLFL